MYIPLEDKNTPKNLISFFLLDMWIYFESKVNFEKYIYLVYYLELVLGTHNKSQYNKHIT